METYSQIYNYCTATNEQQMANGSSRAGSRSGRTSKGLGASSIIKFIFVVNTFHWLSTLKKAVGLLAHRPVSLVLDYIKDLIRRLLHE